MSHIGAHIGDSERAAQNRVIRFFRDELRYAYLGDLREGEHGNILPDRLRESLLRRGYSETLAAGAMAALDKAAADLQQGLYAANKTVYSLLKYGAKVREAPGEPERTVYCIDFERIDNNDFAVAEEVTVAGKNPKRPDVVLYVNGIALAVLELKKSAVSVSDGIRQNIANQRAQFIERFFTTIQFCLAGNESEGLRYGTVLTPEKHYLEWRPDGFTEFPEELGAEETALEAACRAIPERLFRDLRALCDRRRFLNLIHNFVVFDRGIKKVCRFNQYYAVTRARRRLTDKGRGGIVWHTQGSGKSLTMVWLAKWILAGRPESRVLIVTDREELDEQIEKTFRGVDERIVRTTSGRDLLDRLNRHDDRLLCSLVHKFGRRSGEGDGAEADYERYIEDLRAALPKDFSARGEIVVFVDECHRTQSGKLHRAMKAILPSAVFIGFTGTPLLKRDKKTSLEVFGGYIHTYKFNEAVRDGVVLDLRYEARDIPQDIGSQEKIDAWFEAKTAGLTPRAKAKLKARWGTMQKVFSSRSRLEKIAGDIIFDFATKPRLMDGAGNALLVAGSVYAACKYYEIFQEKGFRKCAIISSYEPNPGDLRTEAVSDEEDTEAFEKYEIYLRMVGLEPGAEAKHIAARVQEFEREARRKFIEEPANMKLLIVVDKLLTGFDAPPCTCLYIDKAMRDHGLFQAICRVNRLDGESKDFGSIVDYKQLFGELTSAVQTYTAEAFADYDVEDVAGLLKDRAAEARRHFLATLEELEGLCEGVSPPRAELDYIHYFCGESGARGTTEETADEALARGRDKLYRLAAKLARAWAEFKPRLEDTGDAAEGADYEARVTFSLKLRDTIGRASGDFLDMKLYEPGMRHLIDNYIEAEEAHKIGDLGDRTLLDFILAREGDLANEGAPGEQESAAEAIENNIRKKVVERLVVNPAYYALMSEILEKLIADRKKGVIAYKELLRRYLDLVKQVDHPEENARYPEAIRDMPPVRALYDNCGEDAALALRLHRAVLQSRQDGFRGSPVKEQRIKRALYRELQDDDAVERLYRIVAEQEEY